MVQSADALDRDAGNQASAAALLAVSLIAVPVGLRVTWSNLRSGLVGRPVLIVSDTSLTITHRGVFRKPETLDRSVVALASFDTRPTPMKRFRDHPRFHLAAVTTTTGAAYPEWLYSRVTGSPFPILSQVPDVPNLVLVFRKPVRFATPRRFVKAFPSKQLLPPPLHRRSARGLVIRVIDPDRAREAFAAWGVVRPLLVEDVLACAPAGGKGKKAILRDNLALTAIVLGQFALPLAFGADGELDPPTSETYATLSSICSDDLPDADPGEVRAEALGSLLMASPPEEMVLFYDSTIDARDAARFGPSDAAWAERLSERGFDGGYARRWSSGGVIVVTAVFRFRSPRDALEFEAFTRNDRCEYVDDAFPVPGVTGAVGMTFVTEGSTVDQVSFVKGSYRFMVDRTSADPVADHEPIIELAGLALSAARTGGPYNRIQVP